ncbi:glycosyltransferase family 39 protein [Dyadobacter crusticola]|uniref:glycosyltransferase family 39 protein n=1 Tax=Dyadobacter crusticola TaxID=292407 RepID=UPI0004E13CF2|nr:glycosyltransferase family 39 protein [Dyadobacter crusticola]
MKSSLNPIIQIIFITTLIRILLATFLNLGNDEVYYFTYAVQPDWNHFDHPPLIGLFIRLTTLNLTWISDLSMRLAAIFGAAINTWLIAKCTEQIANERAGVFASILYNASIYTSIISGLFILPDSVQLVFWMAALYEMVRIVAAPENADQNKRILLVGIWTGLAMMCKVHGIFLWVGFIGFIVFHRRSLLKNPFLYLSAGITLLFVSPILYWSINNDFITWRFHSGRVTVDEGINFKSLLVTTIGQILYSNPVQFVIYVVSLTAYAKRKKFIASPAIQLLLWCSVPIIFATTLVSLFRSTLPHWSGPGFLGLMIVAAVYIDFSLNQYSKKTYRFLKAAVLLTSFVCVAGPLLIYFFPGTTSDKASPETGQNDPTLDLRGWDELLPAFDKIRKDDIANKRMSEGDPMVAHKWFPGGHIYYYVAYPLKMRFIGLGDLNDLHKFQWLNSIYGSIEPGSNAYYISPSNNFTDPKALYSEKFDTIEKAAIITQKRSGKVARYWYVYRLKTSKFQKLPHTNENFPFSPPAKQARPIKSAYQNCPGQSRG